MLSLRSSEQGSVPRGFAFGPPISTPMALWMLGRLSSASLWLRLTVLGELGALFFGRLFRSLALMAI